MKDDKFLAKLRKDPFELNHDIFKNKVLLGFLNITCYDLLKEHKLVEIIIHKIIDLHPLVKSLEHFTLIDCDLSDLDITEKISSIYSSFHDIWFVADRHIQNYTSSKRQIICDFRS